MVTTKKVTQYMSAPSVASPPQVHLCMRELYRRAARHSRGSHSCLILDFADRYSAWWRGCSSWGQPAAQMTTSCSPQNFLLISRILDRLRFRERLPEMASPTKTTRSAFLATRIGENVTSLTSNR